VALARLQHQRGGATRKLTAKPTRSFLEELVGDVARTLFAGNVRLQSRDLLLENRDALLKLLDGQKREILADLVHDLFLRAVLFVHCRHRSPPRESAAKILCAAAIVTSAVAK
jgi:hypothetical protein